MTLEVSLYIIASYLLGAIPFSIIVCYLFKGVDVRRYGSGNAGATNVYRVAGPVAALLASLLDIAKGALPVLLVRSLLHGPEWLQLVCGLVATVGHILPLYTRFKGGKGVNTLLGVFLVLLPLETLICLAIFLLLFSITRIVSVGSLAAGVTLSLIAVIEKYIVGKNISTLLLCTCLAVTVLVLFTHKENISRLVRGEEKRLTRKTLT